MAGCVKYQNIFFTIQEGLDSLARVQFKLLPKFFSPKIPIPPPRPRRLHSSPLLFKSPLLSPRRHRHLPPPQEASRRFREAAAERLQGHRLRERKVWFGEAQEGMRS
uniref:Uncharacterized protein n=1 Tax=Oryza meridionalis TaxID=40149 RepID=A0A0E0FE60_9ORYZ